MYFKTAYTKYAGCRGAYRGGDGSVEGMDQGGQGVGMVKGGCGDS